MDETRKIKIVVSSREGESSTDLIIGTEKYHVQTDRERIGVVTRIYLQGRIISTTKTETAGMESAEVDELIKTQHKDCVKKLATESYNKEIDDLMKKRNFKAAAVIVEDAIGHFPDNPVLKSYHGFLSAAIRGKYKQGIAECKKVLMDAGNDPKAPRALYYLNLGRALLASNDKKGAIEAYTQGLAVDPEDHELLWEIKKLGMRKKPVLSFLSRSNPLNKYLGMMVEKFRKEED